MHYVSCLNELYVGLASSRGATRGQPHQNPFHLPGECGSCHSYSVLDQTLPIFKMESHAQTRCHRKKPDSESMPLSRLQRWPLPVRLGACQWTRGGLQFQCRVSPGECRRWS